MAKSDQDAALAGMAAQGRTPMGKEGIKFSSPSAKPVAGTLVPKKNTAAGDPAMTGTGISSNVPYSERNGASYRTTARYMKPTDPAAGLTQANGRVISPAIRRQSDSFGEGVGTSY